MTTHLRLRSELTFIRFLQALREAIKKVMKSTAEVADSVLLSLFEPDNSTIFAGIDIKKSGNECFAPACQTEAKRVHGRSDSAGEEQHEHESAAAMTKDPARNVDG